MSKPCGQGVPVLVDRASGNSGLWMWTSMALEVCSPWTDVLGRVMALRPWAPSSRQRRSDFGRKTPGISYDEVSPVRQETC